MSILCFLLQVTEGTPASLAPPLLLTGQSLWKKENQEPLVAMVSPVSPDPEVTQLCV